MARLAEDQLHEFYEQCYTPGADGEKYRRWRELGAEGKADHVVALVERAGIPAPTTICEVGCGDGAVLGVLGRRGFGERRVGYEISSTGVKLAAERGEVAAAAVFDGEHLPDADGAYDLVFATHVLEHVPDPAPLTRELLRVAARAVIIEVPLEDNLSARRPAARAASEGVGHLHRFDRRAIRRLVTDAGWRVGAELVDPLPREVHTFGAETPRARLKGDVKWAVRAGAAAIPALGERLITLHFAVLALPPA
jgi:SAM-dependent methyltransferase